MAKILLSALFLAVAAVFFGAGFQSKAPGALRPASSEPSLGHTVLPAKNGGSLPSKPVNVKSILDQRAATINIPALQKANDPGLQKLAEYETATSGAFGGMMIFVQLPLSVKRAPGDASDMAAALKEYAKLGIKPLVIVEPSNDNGTIDFSKFASGYYDPAVQSYFAALKQQGISDQQMGMWVPFPEPNTDSWGENNSRSQDFVSAFNGYAVIFKKYFPSARLSIMLDSQTYNYQTGDYSYASLEPYISGINKSYISSFGLQGFPWAAQPGTDDVTVTDAAVFLNADNAVAAAKSLGVGSIWFNTGTYRAMFTNNLARTVTATAAQRALILDSILGQTVKAQAAGFNVSVNIFAQNKSADPEAIDWSYWTAPAGIKDPDGLALSNFASKASQAGIFPYVFDSN
jgi:hypothetical protein